jgi:hypothetical protein
MPMPVENPDPKRDLRCFDRAGWAAIGDMVVDLRALLRWAPLAEARLLDAQRELLAVSQQAAAWKVAADASQRSADFHRDLYLTEHDYRVRVERVAGVERALLYGGLLIGILVIGAETTYIAQK